jgi:hypothetical protein
MSTVRGKGGGVGRQGGREAGRAGRGGGGQGGRDESGREREAERAGGRAVGSAERGRGSAGERVRLGSGSVRSIAAASRPPSNGLRLGSASRLVHLAIPDAGGLPILDGEARVYDGEASQCLPVA